MSLANLSEAYDANRRQLAELQELIALWFNESDCGARDFLVEVGRMHREKVRRQSIERVEGEK